MAGPPDTQYGIVGARLGFRLGYLPADLRADRETHAIFRLDDVPVKVRVGSTTIRDVINDTPNTCALTIDAATPPKAAQRLTVKINSNNPRSLFAGPLQTVGLSYELLPAQNVYPCQAIDDTPLANRKLPYGAWVNTSGTIVGQWLVATFATGCRADFVQANLPPITVNFDGSEGMDGCLRQVAKLIGGYFYWEDKQLHLFTEEPGDAPDPIDDVHPFLNDPAIALSVDTSQVRTRVYGKGYAEEVIADVAAGDAIVPISNAVMFNPAGGQAVSETQRLRYTGTAPGGGGSLVGPGIGPAAAPVLALVPGGGVTPGVHAYALTFLTAAGESLLGPIASITAGTAPIAPPATAPTVSEEVGIQGWGGPGTTIKVWVTFVTAAGETTIGPQGSVGLVLAHGGQQIRASNIPIGPAGTTARRLYQGGQGGGWSSQTINVTVIGDNTTTTSLLTYPPTLYSNAGQIGPPTNTAGTTPAAQVQLTGIPIGAASVTGRKIYRTAAGASQLKLLTTIADNVATTYTDAAADAALGANAPTNDTSGLKQPDGVVLAGANALVVAGAGWATPGGGWAVIGNGQQTIRYTAVAGNTLTGIPASGPGAIVATVSYGSTITAAAALLGVTGLLRALIKGAPINLWVQRDNLDAQAAIAAVDHSDGVIEHLITDERRGEASLAQLCDADLDQYAYPIQTVPYATRDTKTHSGKPVVFNLATPAIHATLTIQEVTITEIDVYPRTPPKFTASASSVRYSLDDILRRLGAALDVTT
jgi:hypothetical protein